jgi:hypothetical protein
MGSKLCSPLEAFVKLKALNQREQRQSGRYIGGVVDSQSSNFQPISGHSD